MVAKVNWFRILAELGPSKLSVFNSFGEMAKALSFPWADLDATPDARVS